MLPQYPSPRCILFRASQPMGSASCLGKPLASLGGRAVPLAGKVRWALFHADAGLCQQPWLICHRAWLLPSGRSRRAGGWEGLVLAALELEGPSTPSAPALAAPG